MRLLLAVVLALALWIPTSARAVLITTVTFAVKGAANDPAHAGETATGTFSFDNSLLPPPNGSLIDQVNGLGAISIAFSWDGVSWTTANADLAGLFSAYDGKLGYWFLRGKPGGLNEQVRLSGLDDINLSTFSMDFDYWTESDSPTLGSFPGRIVYWTASTVSVPEPGTLSLLGLGLLSLGLVRTSKHTGFGAPPARRSGWCPRGDSNTRPTV